MMRAGDLPILVLSALLTACAHPGTDDENREQAVWDTVERRNQAWVDGDLNGYTAIHHPEYLRWSTRQPVLQTRDDIPPFWNRLHEIETSLSIKVIPERLQFLADGRVAIAHYTIEEVYERRDSGETMDAQPEQIPPVRAALRLRFSDIYENVDGSWLYVGGHRDGSTLPERGRVPLPPEFDNESPDT